MSTTTYFQDEIKSAIARSISHDERVTVNCEDTAAALESIDNMESVEELDHAAENDGSLDVWGVYQGNDFRLRLISAE